MANASSRPHQSPPSLPLRLVLVVPFVLQIVLAVGVTGWLSWRNGQQAVEDIANRYKNEVANRIQQHVQNYLAIPEPINQINAGAVSVNDLNLQNQSSVERYIWRQIQLFSTVDSIQFGTEAGDLIAIERTEDGGLNLNIAGKSTGKVMLTYRLGPNDERLQLIKRTPNYDPRIRPWYAPTIALGKTVWSEVFQKFSYPKLLISKATPLRDRAGKIIGVTGVNLSLTQIDRFLQSIKVGESGLTFIMERSGNVVASSIAEPAFTVKGNQIQRLKASDSSVPLIRDTARHILSQSANLQQLQSQQELEFTINGKLHFLQVIPLRDRQGIDWLIAVAIPEADFLSQIHDNNRNTALLCLLSLCVAIAFGVASSKWITKPIQQLIEATEAAVRIPEGIASGQLDQEVKPTRIKELGALSHSFNLMAARLRESFRNLAKTNEELEIRVQERTAELRQSEKKFTKIFLSSPNPSSIVRMKNGQIIDVNDSAVKFFGYADEESADSGSLRLDIWEDERDRREVFQILKETGSIRNREYTFHTSTGEPRTVLYSGEIIELNGEDYLLGILNDITDRKQLEMELWRSQKFLDSIIDNIPLAVSVKDVNNDFRNVIWNKASERVFGITKRAIFWRRVEEFYSPKQASFFLEGDLDAIEQASTVEIPEAILDTVERGRIVLRTLKVPIFNEAGEAAYLICISEDVSDRHQAEITLQQAKEAAEVANRAKSEFLANMSHELRTPLNGVLGYVQILKRSPTPSPQQLEGLNIIQQCGEHLLTLINDILDISKIEARRMELNSHAFHLPSFLSGLANIFQVRAEQKGITFTYTNLNQIPQSVETDEQRLRQILINLLGNAVKFTERGQVDFKVSVIETQSDRAIKMRFQVDDTGSGISSDQLEEIFLPFQQVGDRKRMTEGTGLGLAISKKIVEMMGSSLKVSSTLGQGSSFWFDLDLLLAEHAIDPVANQERQIVGYQTKSGQTPVRILIVDDKRENRLVLVNLLNPLGFATMEAANGLECVQRALEYKPDVILLDLVMPVMDGFEATRQLRQLEAFQDTAIVAVSASVFGYDQSASIDVGCNAFIPKPVKEQVLLDCLKNYLDLEWEYAPESATISPLTPQLDRLDRREDVEQRSTHQSAIPDLEVIQNLMKLAMMGDVVSIEEQANQLEQQNERFKEFTTQLRQLAKGFQIKQIQSLLKQYLAEQT